jgi:hypothetical protein
VESETTVTNAGIKVTFSFLLVALLNPFHHKQKKKKVKSIISLPEFLEVEVSLISKPAKFLQIGLKTNWAERGIVLEGRSLPFSIRVDKRMEREKKTPREITTGARKKRKFDEESQVVPPSANFPSLVCILELIFFSFFFLFHRRANLYHCRVLFECQTGQSFSALPELLVFECRVYLCETAQSNLSTQSSFHHLHALQWFAISFSTACPSHFCYCFSFFSFFAEYLRAANTAKLTLLSAPHITKLFLYGKRDDEDKLKLELQSAGTRCCMLYPAQNALPVFNSNQDNSFFFFFLKLIFFFFPFTGFRVPEISTS